MLGDALGRVFHSAFPTWTAPAAAYGLVAMAAVFAAAAEAPITAIMIVFEMSDNYTIILPLMTATVIATILGRRFLNSTVYELKLERRGIDWQRVRRPRPIARTLVSSIERRPVVTALDTEPASDVIERLHGTDELVVPVIDGSGNLVGIAPANELAWSVARDPTARVGDVARPALATLVSTETLERAADLMTEPHVPLLPVVVEGTTRLKAVVTRRDVLDAYRSSHHG
jgi:CIC family chloride channel protein